MTLLTSWRENSVCNCLHIREIQNYFKTVEAEVRQIQVKNEVQLLRATSKKKKNLSNELAPSALVPSLAVFKPKEPAFGGMYLNQALAALIQTLLLSERAH